MPINLTSLALVESDKRLQVMGEYAPHGPSRTPPSSSYAVARIAELAVRQMDSFEKTMLK